MTPIVFSDCADRICVLQYPEEDHFVIAAGQQGPRGMQGPAGPAGGNVYTFTQATALATWTIPHNLNRYPSVTVVDNQGNVITPDIRFVDANIVQVMHATPTIGSAYLN